MKPLLPLAAAAAFFLGAVGPARAADVTYYGAVGHWQIVSGGDECRASSEFLNGTELGVYLTASGILSISIGNAKWAIPEGVYEVIAQVDRSKPGRMSAVGKGTWVSFRLSGSESDFNLLSYGKELYVTIGDERYQYDLYRSEAMLKALGQCAATRPAAANPFGGKQAPASTETPSNPFRRL